MKARNYDCVPLMSIEKGPNSACALVFFARDKYFNVCFVKVNNRSFEKYIDETQQAIREALDEHSDDWDQV